MRFPRASGILLHITSLPSRFGIGDLGPAAFEFINSLKLSGQKYWQILPLGQTGYGNSPYNCYSAFAGNINLISPESLAADGLLQGVADLPESFGRVNFRLVGESKGVMLREAFENFKNDGNGELTEAFYGFCAENSYWIEDYSLFQALKTESGRAVWNEWQPNLRHRDPSALAEARNRLSEAILAEKFYQFLFFRQWFAVRKYAAEKEILIIGDVPIYVAFDSADVWRDQADFKLKEDGSPRVAAGVPPDYFSKTGQLWGNPIYNWERMRYDGFPWWVERMRFNLALFDAVRIDHFIGFLRAWEVPGSDRTAENGEWVAAPGNDLLLTFCHAFGNLPFIAEDLGDVTPEVELLRDSFDLPGMRILQFAFGGDARNIHLPHNHINNAVVYTGTHDNETSAGWQKARRKGWKSKTADLGHCLEYLNSDGRLLHWDFIRAAYSSVADLAVIPMQDILGLDNRARMNLPGTAVGNWEWRCKNGAFSAKLAEKLRALSEMYGR